MTHELKLLPQYFNDVENGIKNFEIRKNDRDYKVGDTLLLREWSKETGYTGKEIERKVDYIHKGDGQFGIAEGYCILGLHDPMLTQIKDQIIEESDFAYADFDRYKEEVLGIEPDELPDDDFRYGMNRAVEIICDHAALKQRKINSKQKADNLDIHSEIENDDLEK